MRKVFLTVAANAKSIYANDVGEIVDRSDSRGGVRYFKLLFDSGLFANRPLWFSERELIVPKLRCLTHNLEVRRGPTTEGETK